MTAHHQFRFAGASTLLAALAAHCPAQIAFGPSSVQPISAAARHVVQGQFDADHRPDFAIATDTGITILGSRCGGGYGAPLAIANGLVLANRGSLTAGDLDGDGFDDLVAVRVGTVPTLAEVVYLRSLGDGTFAAPQTFAVLPTPTAGQTPTPLAVTIADLDGDGHRDVAVAISMLGIVGVPGYIGIALAQPGPVLATAVLLPTGQSFTNAIEAADMDNDGDRDLIVSNWSDHSISILLNDGTGIAGTIGTERVGHATSALATRFAVGDIDGDGWQDVCVLRDNSAHPLLALGAGNPRMAGLVRDTGITIFIGSQSNPPTDVAADIALVDLDGDGVLDLAAGVVASVGGTGRVVGLRGLGGAVFGAEQVLSSVHDGVDLAVADFDLDGDQDLAAAGGLPQNLLLCTNAKVAPVWSDLGFALPGSLGTPCFDGTGSQTAGAMMHLRETNVLANTFGGLLVSPGRWDLPFLGGILVPDMTIGDMLILLTDATGAIDIGFAWPAGVPIGTTLYWQAWAADPSNPTGIVAANALQSVTR